MASENGNQDRPFVAMVISICIAILCIIVFFCIIPNRNEEETDTLLEPESGYNDSLLIADQDKALADSIGQAGSDRNGSENNASSDSSVKSAVPHVKGAKTEKNPYQEGYDTGYELGEDDAASGVNKYNQYDEESSKYKGQDASRYRQGFHDGYEDGYGDNVKS